VNKSARIISGAPDSRLSKLAAEMAVALDGHTDVSAIILLDDKELGCVHPVGYARTPDGTAEMLADLAVHLMWAGRVLGVDIEVSSNGVKVPFPEPEEQPCT